MSQRRGPEDPIVTQTTSWLRVTDKQGRTWPEVLTRPGLSASLGFHFRDESTAARVTLRHEHALELIGEVGLAPGDQEDAIRWFVERADSGATIGGRRTSSSNEVDFECHVFGASDGRAGAVYMLSDLSSSQVWAGDKDRASLDEWRMQNCVAGKWDPDGGAFRITNGVVYAPWMRHTLAFMCEWFAPAALRAAEVGASLDLDEGDEMSLGPFLEIEAIEGAPNHVACMPEWLG